MLKSSQERRVRRAGMCIVACATLHCTMAAAHAADCQNQVAVDACKLGCAAAEGVCSGVCGGAEAVCKGTCTAAFETCDFGCDVCDVGCEACCCDLCVACSCSGCRDDCDDCRTGCDHARADCNAGCELDCSGCILDCESDCDSICIPFRKLGEPCIPLIDRCDERLVCWPGSSPDDLTPRCMPNEDENLFDDTVCRALWSPQAHLAAIVTGGATTYGYGGTVGAGVAATEEFGGVYGADGTFGCYVTECLGGALDAEIGAYAAVGLYLDYDVVAGGSRVFFEEAGGEVFAFSTSQILSREWELIGTADALSIEVSLNPIGSLGYMDCTTVVDTVGSILPDNTLAPIYNSPPQARCEDEVIEVCAAAETCDMQVDVNKGSVDPDGDVLTLTQEPAGPYGIGEHDVELTARDPEGASRTCMATILVTDCTEPEILCPEPLFAECEVNGQTTLHPGLADAVDCSDVTALDPGEASYPLGTTTVTHTVTDAAGLSATCETTVTIEDVDSDGDGILDCLDACPNLTAFTATGCGGFVGGGGGGGFPGDDDEDGVNNGQDICEGTAPGAAVDRLGCTVDDDGDGVLNGADDCPDTALGAAVDATGCVEEVPQIEPALDSDADGVSNDVDLCLDSAAGTEVDEDGCALDEPAGEADPDTDGDGVSDDQDLCPRSPVAAQVDADGCPVEEEFSNQQEPGDSSTDSGAATDMCGTMGTMTLSLLLVGLIGMPHGRVRRRYKRSS